MQLYKARLLLLPLAALCLSCNSVQAQWFRLDLVAGGYKDVFNLHRFHQRTYNGHDLYGGPGPAGGVDLAFQSSNSPWGASLGYRIGQANYYLSLNPLPTPELDYRQLMYYTVRQQSIPFCITYRLRPWSGNVRLNLKSGLSLNWIRNTNFNYHSHFRTTDSVVVRPVTRFDSPDFNRYFSLGGVFDVSLTSAMEDARWATGFNINVSFSEAGRLNTVSIYDSPFTGKHFVRMADLRLQPSWVMLYLRYSIISYNYYRPLTGIARHSGR